MSHARTFSPNMPLFDKYGGLSGLRSVIMDFYDRVLDSDVVGHFFEDVDMPRLVDHQTKFFAALLNGPVQFAEERLVRAHANLKVTDIEFDEIAELLQETLTEAGFTEDDRKSVLTAVEARRPLIVKRGS
ncbi:group I truncated hemoglobin [Primorskyibacter sp. S87]|uniref:group I truncated hemoglobin n=1 Tax=Primorskyibacter sp. S87 TaxID=3415126 RepID=UPI003C7BA190